MENTIVDYVGLAALVVGGFFVIRYFWSKIMDRLGR